MKITLRFCHLLKQNSSGLKDSWTEILFFEDGQEMKITPQIQSPIKTKFNNSNLEQLQFFKPDESLFKFVNFAHFSFFKWDENENENSLCKLSIVNKGR